MRLRGRLHRPEGPRTGEQLLANYGRAYWASGGLLGERVAAGGGGEEGTVVRRLPDGRWRVALDCGRRASVALDPRASSSSWRLLGGAPLGRGAPLAAMVWDGSALRKAVRHRGRWVYQQSGAAVRGLRMVG